MKYTDLTKEQKEHFDILVRMHGEPPVEATHFDEEDPSESAWMRDEGSAFRYYTSGGWYYYGSGEFPEIPEKPWIDRPQQKVDKIVYDKNAFRKAIEYVCKENPFAQPEWEESLPSKVGNWMKELVEKYQTGDIDGTAFTSTAGLTLLSCWSGEEELTFELLVDPAISDEPSIQLYDPSEVFRG